MELTIKYKNEHPLRDVHSFLHDHALERFGVNPPALLDRFCVAYENGEIVGCCGGSLAKDGTMHIETNFTIGDSFKPFFDEHRNEFSQVGRWMCVEARAAQPVLRGVIESLKSDGANFALCEIAPGSRRRARTLGLAFESVESVFQFDSLDPIERDYYAKEKPQLYVVDFSKIHWR